MPDRSERSPSLDRRSLMAAGALAGTAAVTAAALPAAAADLPRVVAEEHWVTKGAGVRLYVYRKHLAVRPAKPRPVLFLVHGSTFASRSSYDLQVPGRPDSSTMDHFARLGFDVWTMDHEGYGFSQRTDGNSDIKSGVDDLAAALPLVARESGQPSVAMFGESSGAIRAGAFQNADPARISRLILHAFTYTGKDAPEIERRRRDAATYRASNRRPFGRAQIENVFNRDVAGAGEPAVMKALADFELKFGDSVPSGTYLDMAVNMPMVDPKKITCPMLLLRPEHDGNESEPEIIRFFTEVAAGDKQLVRIHGLPHGGGMIGPQRQRLWHLIEAFLTFPVVV